MLHILKQRHKIPAGILCLLLVFGALLPLMSVEVGRKAHSFEKFHVTSLKLRLLKIAYPHRHKICGSQNDAKYYDNGNKLNKTFHIGKS